MRTTHFLFVLVFIVCLGCKDRTPLQKVDYYVISKSDSLLRTGKVPPPQPPRFDLKFYTDLVFIMGNNNKVYAYQTERFFNSKVDKSKAFEFPQLIGLEPEHLLTIDSRYFGQFLADNNDIFQLGKREGNPKFVYIASETDTIKNPAFYEMVNLINRSGLKRISYLIRRTTEEESNVLACKKVGIPYDLLKISWSTHFLDGRVKPFDKEYKRLELQLRILRRAKATFDLNLNESYLEM